MLIHIYSIYLSVNFRYLNGRNTTYKKELDVLFWSCGSVYLLSIPPLFLFQIGDPVNVSVQIAMVAFGPIDEKDKVSKKHKNNKSFVF